MEKTDKKTEIIRTAKWRAIIVALIVFSAGFGVSALVNHSGYLQYDKIITKEVNLSGAPVTDHTAVGVTFNATVGESVTAGQVLYIKNDGKYWKSNATTNTTMPVVALATAAITADQKGILLMMGFYKDNSWSWNVGRLIYASTTSGALTQTRPTGTGKQVQVIGYAYSTTVIYFNPSYVLVELM